MFLYIFCAKHIYKQLLHFQKNAVALETDGLYTIISSSTNVKSQKES